MKKTRSTWKLSSNPVEDKMPANNLKAETNGKDTEKEHEDFEEIDTSAAGVIVPPDGGWGWVVMVASFLCCTVIDGIVVSSSAMKSQLKEEFNSSEVSASFVSSLLSGVYLLAGPFISALANRFGFRAVTIVGAIFSAAAFVISSFANSLGYLYFTFGILGGIGFCMIYIPAVIIIGFYFEKWRALATGIAMCGSGVGIMIFSPITDYLLKELGWRQTTLIQGAIVFSCAIFGLAFRPIQPITLSPTNDDEDKNKLNVRSNAVAPEPQFAVNAFSKPLPEGRFAYSMPNSAQNTYMGHSPKHHYPTAAEVFRGVNLERRLSGTKATELKALRKSQPTTPNGETTQISFNLNKELSTVGENEEEAENENLLTTDTKTIIIQARRHTVSGRRPQDLAKKAQAAKSSDQKSSKPMYRDDAFFTGSLIRLPQYQSQSSLGYHLSVTRLPTKTEIQEDNERSCRICPEAVRRTLSTMLDLSLLKSPAFMLLAFSGFLTMMGFFVPFSFVKDRAVAAGMDESAALKVVTGIGIVNTLSRIGCGSASSIPSVKPLWLNNIAITLGGLATIFSGWIITPATQWAFAVFFGICIACFSSLRSLIAVEMIGLEKLTNAFGLLMLFQGLAATIGGPIANLIFTLTESYNGAFYFAGGSILISAVLCYPLPWVAKWENARNEKSAQSNGTNA